MPGKPAHASSFGYSKMPFAPMSIQGQKIHSAARLRRISILFSLGRIMAWLFVDRLLASVTTKDITEMLSSHGKVERALIFKSTTGDHIAFVEMAAEGDASTAAQAVNESDLLGNGSRALMIHRPK